MIFFKNNYRFSLELAKGGFVEKKNNEINYLALAVFLGNVVSNPQEETKKLKTTCKRKLETKCPPSSIQPLLKKKRWENSKQKENTSDLPIVIAAPPSIGSVSKPTP